MKIGLVMPFTRYDSQTAYDALFGARLALRDWNAKGGVGGYRVELVASDDENDADVAASRARELSVDRDVLGVVGHLSNEAALRSAGEYERAGIPLLTFASGSELTSKGTKGVLRLGPNDDQLAKSVLDNLTGKVGIDRVAVIDQGFGDAGLADAFEREIKAHSGAAVLRESVDRTDRSFAGIIERCTSLQIKLVFFLGDYRQAAAFFSELKSEKEQSTLVAVEGDTPSFVKMSQEGLRGVMYVAPRPLLNREEDSGKKFYDKFVALAGAEPMSYGPITYDAVDLLLTAAERGYRGTGKLSRDAVLDYLAVREPFVGVSGVLAFDERGDLKSIKPMVYRIEDNGVYPGVAIQ